MEAREVSQLKVTVVVINPDGTSEVKNINSKGETLDAPARVIQDPNGHHAWEED